MSERPFVHRLVLAQNVISQNVYVPVAQQTLAACACQPVKEVHAGHEVLTSGCNCHCVMQTWLHVLGLSCQIKWDATPGSG